MGKLIFVYNADSGKKNALMDSIHKMISPQTYNCKLCDITYGVFTENKAWKKFRKSSEIPMKFLHRDEFLKQFASKFGAKFNLPVILVENKGELELLVSSDELTLLNKPEELIALIMERHALVQG
jgi:hypothetical protein